MQQYFYLENCRESSGVRDIVLSAILTLLCSVILLMIQRWLERRGDKLQKLKEIYEQNTRSTLLMEDALKNVISCAADNITTLGGTISRPFFNKKVDDCERNINLNSLQEISFDGFVSIDIYPNQLCLECQIMSDLIRFSNSRAESFNTLYQRIIDLVYAPADSGELLDSEIFQNNTNRDLKKIATELVINYHEILMQAIRILSITEVSYKFLADNFEKPSKIWRYSIFKCMMNRFAEYKPDDKSLNSAMQRLKSKHLYSKEVNDIVEDALKSKENNKT